MRLAITDANIFIDLIYVGFLDHLFSLDFEIHTSAEVIEELNENQQRIILGFRDRGLLTVQTLTEEEHGKVALIAVPKSLSDSDVIVVFLAKKLNALVLSGDGVLRKHCEKDGIEVHGILWLLDRFLENGLTTHGASLTQLEKLIQYNDRLPKNECDQRLRLWRSKGDRIA